MWILESAVRKRKIGKENAGSWVKGPEAQSWQEFNYKNDSTAGVVFLPDVGEGD